MSSELFDRLMRTHRIDQAICEAEKEYAATEESLDVDDVFNKLNEKYYGCK